MLALLACTAHMPPGPKVPDPVHTFDDGPGLSDETLDRWLRDRQGHTVQLPVVVTVTPLGVGPARLAYDPAAEGLAIALDDSAMGISLHDRLQPICAVGECAVILEGRWGEGGLSVRKVAGLTVGTPPLRVARE